MIDDQPTEQPTHCSAGHDLSVCGVYVRRNGVKVCRACLRRNQQRWKQKQKRLTRPPFISHRPAPSAGDG